MFRHCSVQAREIFFALLGLGGAFYLPSRYSCHVFWAPVAALVAALLVATVAIVLFTKRAPIEN